MRLRNIPRAAETVANSPLVVQDPAAQRGKWHALFGNGQPLHIEVGMGKGRFLLQLAAKNPHINYVGIERYSSVLLRALERPELSGSGESAGRKELSDTVESAGQEETSGPRGSQQFSNLYFICMDAQGLPDVFAPGEVSRVYLNFSDPWPKDRHRDRRLTSRRFLERYDRILAGDGEVEFKTDNRGLFDFTLQEARESGWEIRLCTYDLHADEALMRDNIMTEYEEKFSGMGNPICKTVLRRV